MGIFAPGVLDIRALKYIKNTVDTGHVGTCLLLCESTIFLLAPRVKCPRSGTVYSMLIIIIIELYN